jgi:outer membrane protein assembly factor BamB
MKILPLTLLLVVSLSTAANADNWGHWRGPSGNGVSTTAKPPTEWSDTKNVKWKVAVQGKGSSTPVIWEDKIFVATAVPVGAATEAAPKAEPPSGDRRRGRGRGRSQPTVKTAFKLLCLSRADGSTLWEKTAVETKPHEGIHGTSTFASASPCTDGKHVYVHFGSRGTYCYDMEGELVWKYTDYLPMTMRGTFGEGASPTLADDKLIVPHDHEGQSSLYALDKTTGDVAWKVDRDESSNWTTPLVVEHEGKKQIITGGQNFVRSHALADGAMLWKCGGQAERPVASPVAFGDSVIVGSGHRGSFIGAFKLGGTGDLSGSDQVAWTIKRDAPDIASPILSGNRLYFHKAKSGNISCVNAETGKPFFDVQRVNKIKSTYASPVAANGHVYLTGRSGTTVVIKDAEEFEIETVNQVGETVDATPVPVDNQLFIRGEKHLFCIEAADSK